MSHSTPGEPSQEHPYVAVVVHTSGIHPSTARLITLDAVTFDLDGTTGDTLNFTCDPGRDPGPRHMHGLSVETIEDAKRFSHHLRALDTLLDGRILITHNMPFTWGFIASEARKAMNAAARANRSRHRGRGRRRGRQRVGHVPTPIEIVDTLETARRHARHFTDTRIAAVAALYGVDAPPAVATQERAARPAQEVAAEKLSLLKELFLAQQRHDHKTIASRTPQELRADRFGLQRSMVRVDAVEAPRPYPNPGPYTPGKELVRGMEIVVAPEIEMDPDEVIAACVRAELAYSEKLTRTTSLVVCNETTDLRGKAMHAQRKQIPLMSDTAFMAAVTRVREA